MQPTINTRNIDDAFIHIGTASSQQSLIRKALLHMFAWLNSGRLDDALVQYLLGYVIEHFHTGPYKHGEQHSVIWWPSLFSLHMKQLC